MARGLAALLASAVLGGCATVDWVPTSGPRRDAVVETGPSVARPRLQVIVVDDAVTRRLVDAQRRPLFSDTLGAAEPPSVTRPLGAGDMIEISVFEAPPALLFGGPAPDVRGGLSAARAAVFPETMVSREGTIAVPFVGSVRAAGITPQQLETEIAARLRGKANQPQVVVRPTRVASAAVTVVGEVATSARLPLLPGSERLLDVLAAAGGVRQPVGKTTLQVTRGDSVVSLPLESVIRDPRQNVVLQPGDVVTALFQPMSFTVLGATGRNDEIPFESTGITLAQALARAGGLNDTRADARGVFLFRLEDPATLGPGAATGPVAPDGRVPVVYVVDLRDPMSLFLAQSFPVANRDLLYVSNAPAAELQKFLNLVWGVALPALNILNLTR